MPAKTHILGPGRLRIGETGAVQELDCQMTGLTLVWDSEEEDDTPLLCGDVEPGAETFTAALEGNIYQDLTEGGSVDWSWTNKGKVVPFEFVPSIAAGRRIVGQVKVRPIDVGGEEAKQKMRSDIEWPCVGEPIMETIEAEG